ncbi:MAG: prephenate-dependent tRNA uridine(34) hydroxylase TrhP [bacterium]
MKKPELLSPAGSLKHMEYAFAYGADAVYAGQPRYSLRVRNNSFNLERLGEGIERAHELNKKLFVVSNVIPHNSKVKTFMRDIEPVMELNPDALIMADPGLIMMVKERWPDTEIHLSVQANAVNWATVKFWQNAGVKRVILSRELSLEEIQEIRENCPDIELEVFVHGALCIAYSGRCLLSGYINKRDPNQGSCTNACRWKYQAHDAKETDTGDVIPIVQPTLGEGAPTDEVFLLQDPGRPENLMPAFEDEHGTYIMNSRDLRAVQHVYTLAKMGVDCLKIEGRTKSHYYVARTAQVYRRAIDDAMAGKEFDMSLMDILEGMANRGFTEGFYRRHVHDQYQNYEQGVSVSTQQQFVGEIIPEESDEEFLVIEVKNHFRAGDQIEIMSPHGNVRHKLDKILDKYGNDTGVAPGSGHQVKIPNPGIKNEDKVLLIRDLA